MSLKDLTNKAFTVYVKRIGFWWGVAESTLLFILPDFFLAPAIIARPQKIGRLVLVIAAGSALGTLLLSLFVAVAPDTMHALLLTIPFTYEPMFAVTAHSVHSLTSVFFQPFSGVPVKVWAWTAVTSNSNYVSFFIVLMLGRLFRLSLVAVVALGVERIFGKSLRRHGLLFGLLYLCIFFASLALVAKSA